jgi:hypothetical protein
MHKGHTASICIEKNSIIMHGVVDAFVVVELKLEVELILLVDIEVEIIQ